MVVFDTYSGDTHCMDRLATAILARMLERRAATTDELRAYVQGLPELAYALESGDNPADVLVALEKLGLVQHDA
ncbi:MAG TPA: hypothetical protein VLX09_01220 [Stellaceae bacterium]|nr:hypothetical protein [Stellaceae bacterium]HUK06463.1 hypothetical protein [Stellaceae bacterium]